MCSKNSDLHGPLNSHQVLDKFTVYEPPLEIPMLTTPQIDAVMDDLEALAPLLSAEASAGSPAPLRPSARAYKEALMTTRVLVEKLRIVRSFCSPRTPHRSCTNCDDE